MLDSTLAVVPRDVPAGFELKMSHTGPDRGLHYWLLADGEAVAYVKVYDSSTPDGIELELCDIETREGYRNRGYATELLSSLARSYGIEAVSHGGTYTADGFDYISSKLKRVGEPATGSCWEPMTFVESWENLETKYR